MYCKLKKDGASYFNEAQGLICKKKDLAAGIFTYDWTKSWFIKSLRALVQTLHGEGVRPHLMRSIRPRRPRLNRTPCELLRRHSHTITDLRFSFYEAWTAFIPPILDGRLGLILSNPHRASNLTHPLVIERLAIIPQFELRCGGTTWQARRRARRRTAPQRSGSPTFTLTGATQRGGQTELDRGNLPVNERMTRPTHIVARIFGQRLRPTSNSS